jgi:hypothetical protein
MAALHAKLKDSDRRFSDLQMINSRANQERDRQLAALDWIERVLDTHLPKDVWAALGDGVVLCKLMTALYPDDQLIKKFNPPNSRRMLLLENIKYFIDACLSKTVGLDKRDVFDPLDLLDGKNVGTAVTLIKRLALQAIERGLDVKWREGNSGAKDNSTASELDAIRARNKFKPKDATTEPESPRSIIPRLEAEAAKDPQKNSVLHLAIKEHCVIDVLSDPKYIDNLEKVNAKKQTPLHLAAQAGDFDAVQALLIAGSSINVTDDEGKTPLHYATESVCFSSSPLSIPVLMLVVHNFHRATRSVFRPLSTRVLN